MSSYVIVMSHLFAEHRSTLVFDLKGSTKNRYVKKRVVREERTTTVITSTAQGTSTVTIDDDDPTTSSSSSAVASIVPDVLLDDNLVEYTGGAALPLSESSRSLVKMAIYNDTLFLASLSIIDYSLLLGLNPHTRQATFGVIDYIRQYTSVERLETSLKSLGSSKEPTVIPPSAYKKRFRAAMERFFGLEDVDIAGKAGRGGKREEGEGVERGEGVEGEEVGWVRVEVDSGEQLCELSRVDEGEEDRLSASGSTVGVSPGVP